MRQALRIRFFLLVLLLALACGAARACPNCKNSIPEAGEQAALRMREGYFWSYLFMTSMPFVAVGGIVALAYFARRNRALEQARQKSA